MLKKKKRLIPQLSEIQNYFYFLNLATFFCLAFLVIW